MAAPGIINLGNLGMPIREEAQPATEGEVEAARARKAQEEEEGKAQQSRRSQNSAGCRALGR